MGSLVLWHLSYVSVDHPLTPLPHLFSFTPIEGSSRPHGEHQKSSDQLQSARDSLERIKSNVAATTSSIDELNQTLREFEQYLPKTTRDIEPTVARTIERDSDGNIEIEPKRRGIGR